MEQRDRFSDALLRDDMRKLNSHLPKNRRTLKELLNDPTPRVPAASGDFIKMKKLELEELSRSLPAEANTRVKLPIVLLRRRDPRTRCLHSYGRSVRRVCDAASDRILQRKF